MSDIKAIGVLETKGFTPLIKGADSASKAANIELLEWRRIGGGYVSFTFEGEVAAVKSAMDSAKEAASEAGDIVSELVISRPIKDIKGTLKNK